MNNKKISKLQDFINESNKIVVFSGAGISTESGIKDFRGKSGLYKERNTEYSPEYMLSSRCLYKDTDTYLKQIHKPFLEKVSKIRECEGNND